MKTNQQMADDLQARGRAYQAAKQRRLRIGLAAASAGGVACLALVVFASGIFRNPTPAVTGAVSSTPQAVSADAKERPVEQEETDTDALPAGNADVNIPIVFGKTDAVKGAQRGEAVLGKATVSPALQALMEEHKDSGTVYYVVTVDFSACFDGEAASGFVYEGKTVAQYDEELERYAAGLPTRSVTATTAVGTETTTVPAPATEEQKAELAAKKAALTAAKAAYAQQWADKIADELRAAGWENTFAGADGAAPEDALLAEGQVRTLLTAAQMAAVTCEADEGILFLPATKIAGNGAAQLNAA